MPMPCADKSLLIQILMLIMYNSVDSDEQCVTYNHPPYGQVGYCTDETNCPDNNVVSGKCVTKPTEIKCCFSNPGMCRDIKPMVTYCIVFSFLVIKRLCRTFLDT